MLISAAFAKNGVCRTQAFEGYPIMADNGTPHFKRTRPNELQVCGVAVDKLQDAALQHDQPSVFYYEVVDRYVAAGSNGYRVVYFN